MAKIGVITFSQTLDNYGQVLQYLAIQEYLASRGHKVCLIREYSNIKKMKQFLKRFLLIKNKKKTAVTTFEKWAECTAKYETLHSRQFEKFRKDNCNIYNLQLPSYKKYFDAFVVGSDQIWSSITPYNFLNFTRYGEKKFTIAPSIGKLDVDEKVVSTIRTWLKDFTFITCREQSAVDMCKRAGRMDAQLILDPTFLITKDTYLKFSEQRCNHEDYVFIYMLGADIPIEISAIYEFARKEGLAVKYVASQGREDEYAKEWATVSEWLTLLANAKYVFTNSFHGMALSCIFQKQFLVFPIIGEMEGMNERIFNIAKKFKCEDRIYQDGLNNVKNPIDYGYIRENISKNKLIVNNLLDSINF